jgi:hypothetical protein
MTQRVAHDVLASVVPDFIVIALMFSAMNIFGPDVWSGFSLSSGHSLYF